MMTFNHRFVQPNLKQKVVKRFIALPFVLGVVVAIGQVHAAEVLYGIRGDWGFDRNADLITIDPTTGQLERVIGWTGITGVGGFAINPLDGTLYAAGGGDGTPGLHTLDPMTGAAKFVGGGVTVKDMGFDSSGTLYAVMAGNGVGTSGELTTIDLTTGGITPIGGNFGQGVGLAFDSSDTLYIKLHNLLYTVDPLNGDILTTTELKTTNGDDAWLRNSLTFDKNDVLYSHEWGDSNPGNTLQKIVTIDPISGITTELGQIPENSERAAISALDFGEIPDAIIMLWELALDVADINLAQGISDALDGKLDAALNALDDTNENNDVAACNALNAFINHCEAQAGNKLSVEQADYLIGAAEDIITFLCGL
jgi:hypothetical protein